MSWLNLSPSTLGVTPPELRALPAFARQCGFEGSDLPLEQLRDRADAAAAAQAAAQAEIRWGLFNSPVYLDMDPPAFEAGLRLLEAKAPLLVEAGCRRTYNHVWSGHNARDFRENFELHRARLARIAGICRAHGLRFGLEFLGPATLQRQFRFPFIRRLDQILELLNAVGDGTGLVLDVFHLYTSGGGVGDLDTVPAALPIVNVHLNDARPDRSVEAQLDTERAMPMETGVIDAAAALAWLARRGYDGPIIAEPFEPWRSRLAAMPPQDAARLVAAKLAAARDDAYRRLR